METETAVKPEAAAAPEPEPGLGPASPAAPIDGAEQPVGSVESPVEGAEPSWWSAVADEEGLKGHETVSRWLTEAREEGTATARQEMQPRLDGRNARLKKIEDNLGGFAQDFKGLAEKLRERAAEDGGVELEAFNTLLKQHAPALEALKGLDYDKGHREALLGSEPYQNDAGELVRDAGFLVGLFGDAQVADTFTQRYQNWLEFHRPDPAFYTDLRQALTKTEVAAALAQEREKLEKDIRAQVEGEVRAKEREGKGNPPAPAGGGGGAGGATWRTKTEARVLHANNKISNAEMKRIRDDPTIPDM